MRIDLNEMLLRNPEKAITAQMTINNYEPIVFFNMIDKLKKFSGRAVITRRSPVRYQLQLRRRHQLKNIMKELAPEAAVLRLTYSVPGSNRLDRLHTELLNYIETL